MSETSQGVQQTESKRPGDSAATVQTLGKVESKTPGRMRVRVRDELRTPQNMAMIQQQLLSHPDVSQVTVNQRTGSVAFTHGKGKDGHNILASIVQETTLLAEVVFEVPTDDEGGNDPEGRLDQQLADLMVRVDSYIYEKTGLQAKGRVVPATIAGLGVTQILFYGIDLATLPGPVLIWIGWDIYQRFGKEATYLRREAGQEAAPQVDGDPAQDAGGAPVTC